ncbi:MULTISPECIES: hypothetical protein [unclassified Pseudomonas]|uniref:hypothetical protein n=1 Tax=unclassified Pseudomonas TaxID=196821 RepID=UPI002AC98BC1|nr:MULTISPECIES: hypothetical protein [unclassified Pseudomonas]MEB0044984.1 hypothetical protein [Pseudomonas sp. Dout3]MEB0096004.1 hypothetical protein [Pseudomonas sp. DC1.2]WPX57868.1 hypothetical protein RHM68_19975 [Pseudomonas sp. DC1.2]
MALNVLGAVAGMLLSVLAGPAVALTQDITAVFTPDPANPLRNEFVNTTPESGICPWHIPARCKQLNIFTIRTAFFAHSKGPIYPNPKDPRQGAMWKVPSEWRELSVTHTRTGEVSTVQMRIAGIGHRWDVRPGVSYWALPGIPWDAQWRNAPRPCESTGYIAAAVNFALFFWLVPEGAGVCSRQPGLMLDALQYSNIEYAYALKTPNPLSMSSGQYTGSIKYSIGPGGDFDFGDNMVATDDVFIFNFTLDVQHSLKVEVPPGGNHVELVPQGGWQAWLQRNRRPERLFRDQTFNLSASSRFKMQLECQYSGGGNTCLLYEPKSGDSVPLNISVSLPTGMTDALGQSVSRRPLLRDGSGTELFQPGFYVDRKPAALHFEIAGPDVEQMLTGSAKTYAGDVTVIWDSEL